MAACSDKYDSMANDTRGSMMKRHTFLSASRPIVCGPTSENQPALTLVIDGGWSDTYSSPNCTVADGCIDKYGRAQPTVYKWPSSAGGKGLKPFIDRVHA